MVAKASPADFRQAFDDELEQPPRASALWRATNVLLAPRTSEARPPPVAERLAAVAALRGCRGRRAVEALVAALDDGARAVRSAAVEALATIDISGGAPRLALAVFHRRADVRAAVLTVPSLPAAWAIELMADPSLRADAQRAAQASAATGGGPALVLAVIAARKRGLIDDDGARSLLEAVDWPSCVVAVLRQLPTASTPPATPMAPLSTTPATPMAPLSVGDLERAMATLGDDQLVSLLTLLPSRPGLQDRFTAALSEAILLRRADVDDRRRLVVAVAVVASMEPKLSPTLIGLAATGAHAILGCTTIPLQQRRDACRSLADWDGRTTEPAVLKAPWARALTTAADGGIDVEVLGGLLRLCPDKPWLQLRTAFPTDAVARACCDQMDPRFLSVPPAGADDRAAYQAMLREVARCLQTVEPEHRSMGRLLSVVLALPADGAMFVEAIGAIPGLCARLLVAALDLDQGAGPTTDSNTDDLRRRRAVRGLDALVRRCRREALAGVCRQATGDLVLTRSPAARAVMGAIARAAPAQVLANIVDGLPDDRRTAALPVVLDEAPPLHREAMLDEETAGLTSPTMVALIRRDGPPRDLTEVMAAAVADANTVDAWQEVAGSIIEIAARRRVSGIARLMSRRLDGPQPPTPSVALCVSVLVSHDAISSVDKVLGSLWPGADNDAAVDDELARLIVRSCAITTMPLHALLVCGGQHASARVTRELRVAPGALTGLVELGLSLQGPLSRRLLEATAAAMADMAVDRPTDARHLLNERLQRLLADVERGDLLTDDDPRRPSLDALRSLLPTTAPSPTAPAVDVAITGKDGADDDDHGLRAILKAEQRDDLDTWLETATDAQARAAAWTALIDGHVASDRLEHLLRHLAPWRRHAVVIEALRVTDDDEMLRRLLTLLPSTGGSPTLQRLREVAGWGARQAIHIAGGSSFGISFVADALGYTRLGARRIFINPLPLLTGVRSGDEIVKGLMVHELGHHRFHAGPDGDAHWRQARTEGLQQLLNLVADEHLERNLKAMAPTRWGEPLRTLAAWAFQHMNKEFPIGELTTSLGPQAFDVLSRQRLGVGRARDGIIVEVGATMAELGKRGSSLARFVRTLRMGKADTSGDPKVKAAMALFPSRAFRASSMAELLHITRQLRDIFAGELPLLQLLDIHRLTEATSSDLAADGIDADVVDRDAAKRQRQRHQGKLPRGTPGAPGGAGLNDASDVAFDDIDTIERVAVDIGSHRAIAATVRRPAELLRRSLMRFGTGMVVMKRRLTGRRIDRGALVSAIVRGDPRFLSSRRYAPAPDVFVGVAIDCSGSMAGYNLDRAVHFGVLIAEAVRGLPDIDARFIGFTDEVIYDAGDARRCAVTSLEADGGNNDAAALAHLARLARASRRKSVLLVMISDGAPTECSVDALRALVHRLMKQGLMCAQVAVEAIDVDDVCFNHHILLDDGDTAGAARRFGAIIDDLLRQARR